MNTTTPGPRHFDRWVLITVRLTSCGVALDYRDETGLVRRADPAARWERNSLAGWQHAAYPQFERFNWDIGELLLPADFDLLVRQGYAEFTRVRRHLPPGGQRFEIEVPWLLPVFVQPPPGLEALPWEAWIEQAVFEPLGHAPRCVLMRRLPTRSPAEAPTLPWVLFDSRVGPASSVDTLRNLPWFAREPAVQSHGLLLHDRRSLYPLSGAPVRPHLVIEGSEPLPARRGLALDALRLRVHLQPLTNSLLPPRGHVPLLRLSPRHGQPVAPDGPIDAEQDPVVNLVYALAHDFAMHELLWILRASHPQWLVELAGNPVANQSLRLSQVMRSLRDDILSGVQPVRPRGAPARANERVDTALRLNFDFTRESRGLTGMARMLAQADDPSFLSFADTPAPPAPAPPPPSPAAPRRVEMTLDRYDEFGVPEPLGPGERQHPLRCGWRYRLAVQIGQPNPRFSALDSVPPPIDDLLPPMQHEAFHALEVCVFAKSFRLLSPATQPLNLPRAGASPAVFFELAAPAQPGQADLRIVIYHRNNLLQSYRLEALVLDDLPFDAYRHSYSSAARPQVSIRLDASGVSDFGAPPGQQARALSVALNDDGSAGGHSLMIKGDATQIESHPAETEMAAFNQQFQQLLQAADQGARFETTVRDLAQLGNRLWQLLEGTRRADNLALARLRESAGLTAQFVRHGSRWSLPWQTLYDLKLPRGVDFRQPQVCLATGKVIRQPGANEYGCRHHPGEPVLCIEGFWCVRHRLELISEDLQPGDDAARPRVTTVRAPAPHPLLALGQSVADGEAVALQQDWQASWQQRLHIVAPADAPVDASFWRDDCRPAMLVLLSHMWEAAAEDNLPRRLYACMKPIEAHEISVEGLLRTKSQCGMPWSAPTRPLVLLLACGSGRQQTLNELVDFTDAFLRTGAAAVVGTEWDVLATDAVRFARHVEQHALKGKLALGEVMRRFHRDEFGARRGLSLIFTAYGSADLCIEEG